MGEIDRVRWKIDHLTNGVGIIKVGIIIFTF